MAFKKQKKKPLRLLRIDIDKRILKDIDYKNPLVLGKFLSSRYKVLGRISDIPKIIIDYQVKELIIALPSAGNTTIKKAKIAPIMAINTDMNTS